MNTVSGDVQLVCRASVVQVFPEDGERAEEEEFAGGIQRAGTGTSSLNHLNVTHLFQWAEPQQVTDNHNTRQKGPRQHRDAETVLRHSTRDV